MKEQKAETEKALDDRQKSIKASNRQKLEEKMKLSLKVKQQQRGKKEKKKGKKNKKKQAAETSSTANTTNATTTATSPTAS